MADKPWIFIASSIPRTQNFLGCMLEERFGRQYRVEVATSGTDLLRRLVRLRDERKPVALVMCSSFLEGANGIEMLMEVHQLVPHAGRVLLTRWGDREAARTILQAMTLGRIDDAIYVPTASPDEEFYRRVTEHLEEYSRTAGTHLGIVRVVDRIYSSRGHELRDGMERNRIPYTFVDAESEEGRALRREYGMEGALPMVIHFDGRVLCNPTNYEIAQLLGANNELRGRTFDLVVVGAGPAGLATSVYAQSEGIHTLVVEPETLGGQAGASSRIRNYPGFPRGVSGADLASRTYQQAWFFGTDFTFGHEVVGLEDRGDHYDIQLSDGQQARSLAVVIASGVIYRRIGIPDVDRLTGVGVFYGAVTTEARALEGQCVYVIGGGNSAGQAAVHLAKYARKVDLLVRGMALRGNMSQYLLHELHDLPNVNIRYGTEVVDAIGEGHLEALVIRDSLTGQTRTEEAAAAFVFIGAKPATNWAPPGLLRDHQGFILTGGDLLRDGEAPASWPLKRNPFPYETSLPGVFAVGDVRHNSIKRITSAVGEGAMTIPYIHARLAELAAQQRKREHGVARKSTYHRPPAAEEAGAPPPG